VRFLRVDLVLVVTLLTAALTGCGGPVAPSVVARSMPSLRVDGSVRDELARLDDTALAERVLIVELDPLAATVGDGVLDLALFTDEFATGFPVDSVVVERRFTTIPYVSLRLLNQRALTHLLQVPGVVRIHDNVAHEMHLASSLPFIGQPAALAAGADGAGTAVAVLDTGLDYRRAAFGSCASPGAAGCRVPFVADFAPDDGSLDDNGHGTNVSGIVLGVAPQASVIGLDVFRGGSAFTSDILAAIDWVVANRATYNIVAINMSLGGGSSTSTCAADAFAAGVASARAAGVLSSISSGNNAFTDRIASPACVPAAVSVGAVYDVNMAGSIGWSPCTDNVLAADRPTCFSNTAPFLSVLAPGAFIDAAGITMSGTSQAAPHVAGAFALLASAFPADTVDGRLDRLLTSGVDVTDPRTGISFPRIDVGAAFVSAPCQVTIRSTTTAFTTTGGSGTITVSAGTTCPWTLTSNARWLTLRSSSGSGPATVTFDVSSSTTARSTTVVAGSSSVSVSQQGDAAPPVGTVWIVGNPTRVNTSTVTLALSATDASGVAQMCISNTATCSSFVAYATQRSWTLAPSGNSATVRAWFKDAQGNVTPTPASVTVAYDATLPTNGTVSSTVADARVNVSWSGFADPGSGVQLYVLVSGQASPPTNCSTGTVLLRSASTSFAHTGLTNGSTYGYRVCAVDNAGNMGTGATVVARPIPETTAPTGTVAIGGAPGPLKSTAVTLTLNAADASTVTEMCISNTASCTAFAAYATTKAWTLASGSGTKTVRAWFRDRWGNTMSSPASASVALDVTLPVDGTATATPGNARIAIAMSGFRDANSGLAGIRLAYAATTAPANCDTGTRIALAATSTSTAITGLTNGTVYGVRVCGIDVAGNLSRGVALTAKPVAEQNVPTGASVSINAGAALTNASAVTLTLAATDDTGVTEMCVSKTTACSAWVPFATTTSLTLASGSGERVAYAQFRDRWGNTTAQVSDSITADVTVPVDGTATASTASATITLSFAGFSDAHSGLAGFRVASATGTAPANCAAAPMSLSSSSTTVSLTGLTNGTTYGVRLCAIDAAGNLSRGVALMATPVPERNAPTAGAVTIQGGASITKTSAVTLTLAASDDTAVASMCISNAATCTTWVPFSTTKTWTLQSGSGDRTVNVWFKDTWGNASTAPVSDAIVADTSAPRGGSITATAAPRAVNLSWGGFTDVGVGVASYKLVTGASPPGNCTQGTVLYEGPATSFSHTGLTAGVSVGYRVCAVDGAGNLGSGLSARATPAN
jgi:subtilisin family serine protease